MCRCGAEQRAARHSTKRSYYKPENRFEPGEGGYFRLSLERRWMWRRHQGKFHGRSIV